MIWVIPAIVGLIAGIPVWWTYRYVAYVRSRREYFLSLSDEARAEIRARRKKSVTVNRDPGT